MATMPRTYHAGAVLVALAMGGFAIGTTEFATMSLLPDLARGLAIDAPTAGHVVSAYALGVVVGAPVLAVVSARMRRGTLLVALMAMFAIGNGLSALAPSYRWMLVFRFLSGLPHGAYFGIAALVAAKALGPERRTAAVGYVMLGLTIATIVGVPAANEIGQLFGWRWGFGIVAALAAATMALVAIFAPNDPPLDDASPLRELGALARRQVWLTLGIGAIGFGGFFAVYAYLASTLVAVTGMAPKATPIVFACFGIGMTIGTIVAPRFADRALMPTVAGLLLLQAAALALFPLAAHSVWTVMPDVMLIGIGGSFGSALQTRLMDVAGDAQSLAAALNHSAFNTANAIGPLLGGLLVWAIAMWDARRTGFVAAAA